MANLRWTAVGISLSFAVACPRPADSQQSTPATRVARAASASVFRAHLEYLADDLLEGRAPATRGGELAAGREEEWLGRQGKTSPIIDK